MTKTMNSYYYNLLMMLKASENSTTKYYINKYEILKVDTEQIKSWNIDAEDYTEEEYKQEILLWLQNTEDCMVLGVEGMEELQQYLTMDYVTIDELLQDFTVVDNVLSPIDLNDFEYKILRTMIEIDMRSNYTYYDDYFVTIDVNDRIELYRSFPKLVNGTFKRYNKDSFVADITDILRQHKLGCYSFEQIMTAKEVNNIEVQQAV